MGGCENGNFDNPECKKEIKTPTNSAEDFSASVNKGRKINEQEKKDPNILPTEDDFKKAFDFTQQVNGSIGDYNPNTQKEVKLQHQENNNYDNQNGNCNTDGSNISCKTIGTIR